MTGARKHDRGFRCGQVGPDSSSQRNSMTASNKSALASADCPPSLGRQDVGRPTVETIAVARCYPRALDIILQSQYRQYSSSTSHPTNRHSECLTRLPMGANYCFTLRKSSKTPSIRMCTSSPCSPPRLPTLPSPSVPPRRSHQHQTPFRPTHTFSPS